MPNTPNHPAAPTIEKPLAHVQELMWNPEEAA